MADFSSSPSVRRLLETPWGSEEVSVTIMDGKYVMQGDIVIGTVPASERGSVKGAFNELSAGASWKGGIVPWQADDATGQRIRDAIWHFEDTKMPVLFVERTLQNMNHFPDYIQVVSSAGCWSHIGRTGGMQELGLHSDCERGEAIHELCHALGLWHEQSRPDRDLFVEIHWDNIMEDMRGNFEKQVATRATPVGDYDYESIMHYGRSVFAKNPFQDTITPLQNRAIGQRLGLSEGDRQTISVAYKKERQIPLVPAHRYWNGEAFDHFYTPAWKELGRGASQYAYEGIEWWMLAAAPPHPNKCVRLVRYYSDSARDHYYAAEGYPPPQGYHVEDADNFVFYEQVPGAVPVYEYFHAERQDHFYTIGDFNENQGWRKIDRAFYAFPTLEAALKFLN